MREAETAIEVAKQTIAVESERELNLSNSDPDRSGELVRKAQRTIARLQKAIPLLGHRLQQVATREYAENWHARADHIEDERDILAKELSALYPPFVQNLANLFARIDALDARISALNAHAPHGEVRRLLEAELTARKLDRFSADQPPLRENLRLPDPSFTREICFPPPAPLDAYYGAMQGAAAAMAQKFATGYSPDWAEAKARRSANSRRV